MRGIYAHLDTINGVIFYIGQQSRDYIDRSHQFRKQRSECYRKYVESIGEQNIMVIWLYISNIPNENLFSIESKFQKIYFQNGFLKTRELIQMGKFNSNYGHNWTKEQKLKMSSKMKGRYDGENNPNYNHHWTKEMKKMTSMKKKQLGLFKGTKNPKATKCILYGPNNFTKKFDLIKDMRQWVSENVTHHKITTSINIINHTKYEKPYYNILREWHFDRL